MIFENIEKFIPMIDDDSSAQRVAALEKFKELGVPDRRVENWRFTHIGPHLERELNLVESEDYEVNLPFACELIKISNGKILHSSALCEVEEISLKELVEKVNENNDAIVQYNYATSQRNYKIKFNKTPSLPVVIYHNDDKHVEGMSLSTGLMLDVAPNTTLNILEIFKAEVPSLKSNVRHVNVGDNSQVYHNVLTQGNDTNSLHLYTKTDLGRDSHYENIKILIDNLMTRNEINVNLNEKGGHTEVHGLYALNNEEHCSTQSQISHNAPHTTSNQLYKGILAKSSRGVFRARIFIAKDSQLVEAQQLNRNLILSKKAHVNSMPQLEIFADDVKCDHGSTTGQLSPEELFYFESRGINPDKAKRILSQAFSYDIIFKIKNEQIKDYVSKVFVESYRGLEEND